MSEGIKIITTYKSPDFNRVIRPIPKKAVLHHSAGRLAGDIATLTAKDDNYVSCHYEIAKNGDAYMLVHPMHAAYHTGRAIAGWGNNDTIGFEFENLGNGKDSFTDAQIKTIAYLLSMYKIPKEGIKDHKAIAIPVGRKSDLASNFPWEKFWSVCYGGGTKVTITEPTFKITIFVRGQIKDFKPAIEKKIALINNGSGFSLYPSDDDKTLSVIATLSSLLVIEEAARYYKASYHVERNTP